MLAAEKASGCTLDLDFRSIGNVLRQRGTISGAIPKDGGFYFDGSNDYIQYIVGSEFYSDAISFVMEFTPEFNWDENIGRSLFGGSLNHGATGRLLLFKYDSGTNYDLLMQIHTTWIQISSATYSPYWKQNKKNTLVISATGTTTTVYLNGIKIANTIAHVWSRLHTNILNIGCLYTEPNNSFKGIIHSFKIYNRALSDQECLDYCNNATFLYEQKASIILPMRLQDHDPTNNRTLDRSGHGYHATFGDGSTASTFPTKITGQRGYSFDGTSDYLSFPATLNSVFTGIFQNPFTMVALCETPQLYPYNPLCRKGSLADGDSYSVDFWIMSGSDDYGVYSRGTDGIIKIHTSTIIPDFTGLRFKAIYIYNKYDVNIDKIILYCQQKNISSITYREFTNTFAENNKQFYIGKDHAGASSGYFFKGNFYYFALYPFSLTQIQMADVYINLMQGINHE